MNEADRRTRKRIPNKTKASLESIVALTMRGRRHYGAALDRNEQKFMDPILSMELARLGDVLDDIRHAAQAALQGGCEGE